jgi:hypothetical protein
LATKIQSNKKIQNRQIKKHTKTIITKNSNVLKDKYGFRVFLSKSEFLNVLHKSYYIYEFSK